MRTSLRSHIPVASTKIVIEAHTEASTKQMVFSRFFFILFLYLVRERELNSLPVSLYFECGYLSCQTKIAALKQTTFNGQGTDLDVPSSPVPAKAGQAEVIWFV
jgi:hypothetical protein